MATAMLRVLASMALVVAVLLPIAADSRLASAVALGDVDCDADVDSVDALKVLQDSAGIPTSADCLQDAADTDCDGDRDAVDALRILQHLSGQQPGTPLGCTPIGTEAAAPPMVLNEVRFLEADSAPEFVELKNVGDEAASVGGLALVSESSASFDVPTEAAEVPPGGVIVIIFDGQDTVDGATVHADTDAFLDDESDSVELQAGGTALDRVAWGDGRGDSVRLSRGAIVDDLVTGMSVGRAPTGDEPAMTDWLPYSPVQASPGQPNPQPGVEVLVPVDGSLFATGDVPLDWYGVPGAAQYRVQVATEDSFAAPFTDETVTASAFTAAGLATGEYFWRVDAVDGEGGSAGFSQSASFSVDPGLATPSGLDGNVLDVPQIYQRKDTRMLHMQTTTQSGPHGWDAEHPDYDPEDLADNTNCALAALAMVNEFFGGSLSQDRLGTFLNRFQPALPPRPEFDLYYDRGTTRLEMRWMYEWALGSFQEIKLAPNPDDAWTFLMAAIDGGVPLVAFMPGHAFVAKGYANHEGKRYVIVNDPSIGEFAVQNLPGLLLYFYGPSPDAEDVTGRTEEASVHTDTDNDGLVDFDEEVRFETDPNDFDTDDDGLGDKGDISQRWKFFDEYGHFPSPDHDSDELRHAHDCDNDNDGILDSQDPDSYTVPPVVLEPVACTARLAGESHSTEIFPSSTEVWRIDATGLIFVTNDDPVATGQEEFDVIAGTLRFRATGENHHGCAVDEDLTVPVVNSQSNTTYIRIEHDVNTYLGAGSTRVDHPITYHCDDHDSVVVQNTLTWLLMSSQPLDDPDKLEGMFVGELTPNTTYEWSLMRID